MEGNNNIAMATPSVIVHVVAGDSVQTLQTLVHEACQQRRLSIPLLPLEHIPNYRLYRNACEGLVVRRLLAAHTRNPAASTTFTKARTQLKAGRLQARCGYAVPKPFLPDQSFQEVHLVPLALPCDPECLGLIANAVAKHNTALDASHVPRGQGLHITPWLASSLAPTAAAVTIQVEQGLDAYCTHGDVEAALQAFRLSGEDGCAAKRDCPCTKYFFTDGLLFAYNVHGVARMKMLAAVRQQATAIAGMQASDRLCLTQQQYLDIFRLQQAHQQGQGLPPVFPEQQIQFAFEEGGLIFGVNHSGAIRCGIPYWTGVSLAVVDEEDMEALAADQLYSSADCAQLLLQSTIVDKVTRPASRGGGEESQWVIVSLDSSCPEPDTEMQMRAAVLLVLTWDIRTQSGIRLWPRPASFFLAEASNIQSIKLDVCASPVPPGPESAEALDRYKDKLGAFASSPDGIGLLWKPVPDRFAVRLMYLRKLGLVPVRAQQGKNKPQKAGLEPVSGLELEHSEAASSGLGPLPPWPTPLQLRQTLADWGRVQAVENAQILAQREAFGSLMKKMHVTNQQDEPPSGIHRFAGTGHAFVPATMHVPSVAEAVARTEELRFAQQAYNQQVACQARQNGQEALAAAKHDAMAARYWKGAIGRAHHAMGKSALQSTVKSQLASSHVHAQTGRARQVRMKQQQHDRKLVSSWHGQINLLAAHVRDTDLAHRSGLQAHSAAQLVQSEQELEAQRQARITQQQHKAQHAKHVAAAAVRKVPQQAQQKRLATLKELQDLVDQRREEELQSLEKTAPSGGVWGSMQQPPWWRPLPLTMVGSVADPQLSSLTQHDTHEPSFDAQSAQLVQQDDTSKVVYCKAPSSTQSVTPDTAADIGSSAQSTAFQMSGLLKPPGLMT